MTRRKGYYMWVESAEHAAVVRRRRQIEKLWPALVHLVLVVLMLAVSGLLALATYNVWLSGVGSGV